MTDPYLPYGGPPALRPNDWRINLLDHIAANIARRHANSIDPQFWAKLPDTDKEHWRASVKAGLGILRAAMMDDSAMPAAAKSALIMWLSEHGHSASQ